MVAATEPSVTATTTVCACALVARCAPSRAPLVVVCCGSWNSSAWDVGCCGVSVCVVVADEVAAASAGECVGENSASSVRRSFLDCVSVHVCAVAGSSSDELVCVCISRWSRAAAARSASSRIPRRRIRRPDSRSLKTVAESPDSRWRNRRGCHSSSLWPTYRTRISFAPPLPRFSPEPRHALCHKLSGSLDSIDNTGLLVVNMMLNLNHSPQNADVRCGHAVMDEGWFVPWGCSDAVLIVTRLMCRPG